jgi:quercetin dioxygenase-like cupin family protein
MKPNRMRQLSGWILWASLSLVVSVLWLSKATRAGAGQAEAGQAEDDPRFTGVSTSMEPTSLSIGRRRFEPGARSAWHHHEHGQLLFVEGGRMRFQKRGEAMQEMASGDSVYTAPNVEHWHGAAPEEAFVQVHVGFGSGITWLDKVTDEEYAGR